MNSKEKILMAVAANQPKQSALPDINLIKGDHTNISEKFIETLTAIGGKVLQVNGFDEIITYIKTNTAIGRRIVSNIPELSEITGKITELFALPHTLQDVELAIINAHLGVAENGAVWIKEDPAYQRILPFICQHLAIVLQKPNIVATMHEAYDKISLEKYGFATFIAGPSKTADIEQSLVLGAHGPRTMTIFLKP